ncbi:MAG TPA: nucleotide exchange factor GrpE [Pyrinomonadaceae bacterium]|nr:nucleotide exchange factor GrpE [Pyrinomonadaceae bacterium]
MNRFRGSNRHNEQSQDEDVRFTDRRRIRIDDDGQTAAAAPAEEPNLKPAYVEELEARTRAAEQKLLEVQSRFDELRAQLQRETDETRQRLNRAADDRAERQKIDFIAKLLPVMDNLQRAVDAAEQGSPRESVVEGLKGTMSSFGSALAAVGAEPVPAVGQAFDPEIHDAVDIVPVEEAEDGIITSEYTAGYKLGDRLLRPARVQVGRAR